MVAVAHDAQREPDLILDQALASGRRCIGQLRALLGPAHVPIGPTTSAQRAQMTADQLYWRNVEIQLRQEELDLALLLDADADHDRLLEALLDESDEIEALLQDKYALAGGGRVWVQPAVAEAARLASRLGARADLAGPTAPATRHRSSWVQRLDEALAARQPPDVAWTRGVLAEAAARYDEREAAGHRRAKRPRRRRSSSCLAPIATDYTWRLGHFWLRLPPDTDLPPGAVVAEFAPNQFVVRSAADPDAAVVVGGDPGLGFGTERAPGAIRAALGAGLAQVDTVLDGPVLLRVAVRLRAALWTEPRLPIRSGDGRRALRTLLAACADQAVLDADELVGGGADPDSLTVAWLYDTLTPSATAPLLDEIPVAIRSEPSRYQRAAVRWMMEREAVPVRHPDPSWASFAVPSPDAADAGVLYDLVEGRFATPGAPVDDVDVPRGGILADQMGLGKTLECLMLIAAHRRQVQPGAQPVVSADGTLRRPCATTLVVVPMNLTAQWAREIALHCPSLRSATYTHGSLTADQIAALDVVLTTFGVLRQELYYGRPVPYGLRAPAKKYAIPTTPLLELEFARLICDEAQLLEAASSTEALTQAAQMAARIAAQARWCVTGTPIGPRGLDDLRPLFAMVGYGPFADGRRFRDLLAAPWRDRADPSPIVAALRRLFWRHSQASVRTELRLPPVQRYDQRLRFASVEFELYRRLLVETRRRVQDDANQVGVVVGVRHLDGLRQACCHPIGAGPAPAPLTAPQTMNQLSAALCKLAADDLAGAERDLCRAGNALGACLGQRDPARAWDVLRQAWYVGDAGFRAAPIGGRYVLRESPPIVTANASHRAWRAIQLINVTLMIAVGRRLPPDADRDAALQQLERQRIAFDADYYEVALRRIAETAPLLDDYLGPFVDVHLQTALPEAAALAARLRAAPDAPLDADLRRDCADLERRLGADRADVYRRLHLHELWLYLDHCKAVHRFDASALGAVRRACLRALCPDQERASGAPPFALLIARQIRRLTKAVRTFDGLDPDQERQLQGQNQALHSSLRLLAIAREVHRLRLRRDELERDLQYQRRMEIERQSTLIDDDHDHERLERDLRAQLEEARQRCISADGHIRYLQHRFRDGASIDEAVCAICLQSAADQVITVCFHIYCRACIDASLQRQRGRGRCPCCRHPIARDALYRVRQAAPAAAVDDAAGAVNVGLDPILAQMQSCAIVDAANLSSKIAGLVRAVVWTCAQPDAPKVLVFSHFKPILTMIGTALDANRVAYRLLTGAPKDRCQAIERFQQPDDVSVQALLMSMRSDASGLTLHAAQFVFLVEPSLNPAIEDQAVGRVHRRGQTRHTTVVRFLIDGSIEERILEIQLQRRALNHARPRVEDRLQEDVSLPELLRVLGE